MTELRPRRFKDLAKVPQRLPSPCRVCGQAPVAAHAEARLRERRPGGQPGSYIATRSLGMCEPCAVLWFERVVALMHGWASGSVPDPPAEDEQSGADER